MKYALSSEALLRSSEKSAGWRAKEGGFIFMRLLLIEDEVRIAQPLKKALEENGYAVDWSETGSEGFSLAKINKYDCLVLDLNLPDMDGLDIAKNLRKEKILTPIIMLTARAMQQNVYEGFESGSDDYLTKPFSFKELLYRIKSLIKRNSLNKESFLKYQNITLNPEGSTIIRDKREIKLNNKEFGIFEYLLRNKGRVISQEELLEHVWDQEIDIFTQTVRTNIKTLRKKIDPDKNIIKTINGRGYTINDE